MRIIIAVSTFLLASCAAGLDKPVSCHQRVSALSQAEATAKKNSDEASQASDKAPESPDLAMAAANAAVEWAAATAKLNDAKASCVGAVR